MCLHVNIYVHECVSTDPLVQKKSPSVVLQGSESLRAGCGSVCLKVSPATSGGALAQSQAFSQMSYPSLDQQSSIAGFYTHTVVQLSVP